MDYGIRLWYAFLALAFCISMLLELAGPRSPAWIIVDVIALIACITTALFAPEGPCYQ